ncbi:MAG TPA: winged helix-turn-helix domain-containing protein, partial [Burkholderiaceae bacterium]|nr:winged helix-turn-helix domain-containing protein [Burkholderiaceae bacterium]
EAIEFGNFRLVPSSRMLSRDGSAVHLGDRALELLIALIERRGRVVSKKELFEIVWPKMFVEESNLRVNIAALRKALGDGQLGSRFITNIPGRGYAFVADVRQSGVGEEDITRSSTPAPDSRSELPARLARIVGRDEIVARIAEELSERRLITITGAGGIGKTAVALAVAEKIAGTYRDGIRILDLATVASPALVAPHLASLLRLPTTGVDPLNAVVAHIRSWNLLLMFDNCEHVVQAASSVAVELLRRAAEVHILATSREPLRATGEWVQRLAPLACPPVSKALTLQQALAFPATRLFIDRVLACDGSYQITDDDAPIIADLCTRLDGLPLAIELAAARVPVFGIRGVVDRLDDRFNILTKGLRTAVPRHQTLGAMIDWSYQSLPEHEKTVWRRLSVFAGSFTLEAATVIGLSEPTDHLAVIDALDSLVEKSLVTVDALASEARYRMLESLRLYALGKLQEKEEVGCVRRRHAEYYSRCSFGSVGDRWLQLPSAQWLDCHSGDIVDIRAAIDWAFSTGDNALAIKLIGSSAALWFKLLLLQELRGLLERALQLAPGLDGIDDDLLMRLHVALAHSIFHTLGSVQEVGLALDKAWAIAERLGDVNAQLQILWARWGSLATEGHYADMLPSLRRVGALMINWPGVAIAPLYNRLAGFAHHLLGDQQAALRHAELALEQAAVRQHAGRDAIFVYDHKIAASSHHARILWMSGSPDSALQVLHAAAEDAARIDQPFAHGIFLVFAAVPVSLWTGDLHGARRHVAELLDAASGIAFNVWRSAGNVYQRALETLEQPNGARSTVADRIPGEELLTPFLIESLATFSWRLLHPRLWVAGAGDEVNWSTAETLRARGEKLLASAGAQARPEAQNLFLRSIDISRRQHARSWELRSATSLARLWHADGRAAEARDLLAGVYQQFSEGFATRDLMQAKALLDSLQ